MSPEIGGGFPGHGRARGGRRRLGAVAVLLLAVEVTVPGAPGWPAGAELRAQVAATGVRPLPPEAAAAGRPSFQEPAASDSARLRPMDVFGLEYASDPRISPDGARIVYVRRWLDVMHDRVRGNLWILNSDGSGHRPLTSGKVNHRSPRWSPDGTRLAYVAEDEDGRAQIFLRWMDTGESAKLTDLTRPPGGLSWSPDGSRIAFTMFVPAERKPLAKMPSPPAGAEWAPSAKVIESLVYRRDGAGYVDEGYRHVFVLPAEGGTPRRLTRGPYDHRGEPVWTPDGKALLVAANRHEEWQYDPADTEIYEISVEDGSLRALTDRHGPDESPALSPGGSAIAYLGYDERYQGYQVSRLHVMNRDGSGSRVLAEELDRDPQNPVWSGDGRGLYFQYDDRGVTRIGYVSLSGELRTLARDVGGTSIGRPYASGSFTAAANGRIAFTHTSPYRPADVAVVESRRRSAGATVLTDLNEDLLGHRRLGTVEEIWAESSRDGRRIQGWIVKPPGFDPARQYPLLLEIHGGPFANYGERFTAEIQLYAAAGYVVLYTNPRGSTSYGEEFGNLIHHAYPGDDFFDLMTLVDAAVERGSVDAERLYVTGGSGGGVLSSWIVGHTDRFRAAAVQKPVINWYSWVLTADISVFGIRNWFPGPPWENSAHYMKRSPISYAGHVTTPTLLITGESDYRTPISESEQFYQALKFRRVPAALVRIPEASHGIAARPSHLLAKVVHILGWFERYGGARLATPAADGS
ncbi:MAG: prolyl oligopeptidase family serine peptidase [Gemmatimonadota bacterium]